MAIMLIKRLVGLAVTAAVIAFGYHYLKNRGVEVPAAPISPTSQVQQNAQNAVQQSQNYQDQLNQKAQQYGQ